MIIKKTFKYRLYPSRTQQKIIDNVLELCRITYNNLLEIKIETYKNGGKSLNRFDLNNCLKYLKTTTPKLKNVHSQVLQNISDRIDKSFKNVFYRIKHHEKAGFPRFKKYYKSIIYPQSGFKFTSDKKLKVSKIGSVSIKKHRELKGIIKNMSIKKTPTNKYYATFSCEMEKDIQPKHINTTVGLDLGLNHFVTDSNSNKFDNPRHLRKSGDKLSFIQRRHSRKKLKSKNRRKSQYKIARLHEKIHNQRLDFTHKLSRYFVDNYDFIGIEDLGIKNMVKNKYLSKSISDAGWSMFINQLCYKAESAGSIIQQVDKFYPSTKTCSECNSIQEMTLGNRTYNCRNCGHVEDRDTNASKNILIEGLRIYTEGTSEINACRDVGLLTSMNQEATHFNG